ERCEAWELEPEPRAVPGCARDGDRAAVGLDDGADDGQPETRSRLAPAGASREALEDAREIPVGDPRARVLDAEDRLLASAAALDQDGVASVGDLHGVLDQCVERGCQALSICHDDAFHADVDRPATVRGGAPPPSRLDHELFELDRLEPEEPGSL